MTIAVSPGYSKEDRYKSVLISQCISRLARKHPEHDFIYFSNGTAAQPGDGAGNIKVIATGPHSDRILALRYHYEYRIPALLKKYKADVLVCADGICSLRAGIPQCLLLQDTRFLSSLGLLSRARLGFYKKQTPKFLHKAKSIATVSASAKKLLMDEYNLEGSAVDIIYGGIDDPFRPVSPEEKERVRSACSEGKEYFLFTGITDSAVNLMTLLKAFSFFKKRLKSNMPLLIVDGENIRDDLKAPVKSFKFREEVKILGHLSTDELARITGASYAVIFLGAPKDFYSEPLQAMRCGVPLITVNGPVMKELCADSALYTQPGDVNDLAEKMMTLFRDEDQVKQLVAAGIKQSQRYDWDQAADGLWQNIQRAANG